MQVQQVCRRAGLYAWDRTSPRSPRVSDLFLYSPPVFLLCVAIENDGQRIRPSQLFLSLCPVSFRLSCMSYFSPVSSALFDTLDEAQLFIGLAFLNPRHGTATTTFPFPFSPISALFFPLVFLSANEAAPRSLSSGTDCCLGRGVCLMLMSLLFEIHPFISAFISTPPVILYVFVCCFSSHRLLFL